VGSLNDKPNNCITSSILIERFVMSVVVSARISTADARRLSPLLELVDVRPPAAPAAAADDEDDDAAAAAAADALLDLPLLACDAAFAAATAGVSEFTPLQ
jgi:hypothetical protein